jgi:DNA polymerase-4
MVEKLAFQLRGEQKLCACIAVKIRYSDFETTSRQIHISGSTGNLVKIPPISLKDIRSFQRFCSGLIKNALRKWIL